MTEHTIPSFDGTSLYVIEEGATDAPPVMLSHAVGTSVAVWNAVVPQLITRFRVLRFDSRGHGRSAAPEGPYSVQIMGRDALAVLDRLGVARAHFVGLSQGGMTGMWLAAHHPTRVKRLVISNSAAFIPARDIWPEMIRAAQQDGMNALGERMIKGWLSAAYQSAHPEEVQSLVAAMQRMSSRGFVGAIAMLRDADLRADLARIQCPTLVITGMDDGPHAGTAAATLVQGIAGARHVELPRSVHLSPLDNPEGFSEAVVPFLS